MSTTIRSEQIETGDGAMGAHLALPASGGGPGIVLIHEIFGVNDYVRDGARRLAELGYVTLAPDLFGARAPAWSCPTTTRA